MKDPSRVADAVGCIGLDIFNYTRRLSPIEDILTEYPRHPDKFAEFLQVTGWKFFSELITEDKYRDFWNLGKVACVRSKHKSLPYIRNANTVQSAWMEGWKSELENHYGIQFSSSWEASKFEVSEPS